MKKSTSNIPYYSLLLCDSDANIREMLKEHLQTKQYYVQSLSSAFEIQEALKKNHFDLLLLEIDPYSRTGMKTLIELRKAENDIPIICLGRDDKRDVLLEAYQNGCDDYMTKPLSMEILTCHIDAILRRQNRKVEKNTIININGAIYDAANQTFNGQHINTKVGMILQLLYNHEGEIVEKNTILTKVWKQNDFFTARSLTVYIQNLRKLLLPYGYKVLSFSKIGYKLVSTI